MAKYSTQGLLLQIGETTDASSALSTIGNLNSFSPPIGDDSSEIDVTDYTSTVKEFILGLKDGGSMDVSGFWDSEIPEHAELISANNTQTLKQFLVTFTDGTTTPSTLGFNAFVKNLNSSTEIDDAFQFTATLRVSGTKTYTPAT